MGSHKMETSVKRKRKRRPRPKKNSKQKDSELNSLARNSKSPTWNLGVKNLTIKKKPDKVKKVSQQYLNSIIEGFCEQQISLAEKQKKDCEECGQLKRNLFNQTVDLSDDSFVNDSNSSILIVPSCHKNEVLIDLSNDLAEQNEVVDLTEPQSKPQGDPKEVCVLEPTVIDLSEDESKEKSNLKHENDDILVIGTFSKHSELSKTCQIPMIQLSNRWTNYNNIINCSDKLKKKYLKKQSVLDKIDNKNMVRHKSEPQKLVTSLSSSKVAKIGENIYVDSPVVLPSQGLRPIIIDGSNVAFVASHRSDDPQLLRKLERQGDVILTPSKKIDGRNIVPYDDRFIVQTAVLKGGIIVTRDNYNDLLKENPAWAETIKYRTLAFTWVDDVLMFPKDPLGEYGPSLEEFLRFQ